MLALMSATVACVIAAVLVPRIPQPQSYHNFADQRPWLGVSNFGDVASNVPFAVVGIWGLILLASRASRRRFIDQRERWPYVFVFLGLLWTAFGSAYYHLAPNNDRLMWDRLPMIVVFMPLVAAMIMERLDVTWGLWLLPVLLAVGAMSVIAWHISESHGQGDLRLYAAVQLYSVLALVILLFVPPRYTHGTDLIWVGVFYVAAKLLEASDGPIFRIGHLVSGHTLKHLAAGVSGYWILRMLQKREPVLSTGAVA